MKKNLTMMAFVACAALTIVSCSNDEVADSAVKQKEQAIEFGTYVGRDVQSRGAVTDLDALKQSTGKFGVFAHYTQNADYSAGATAANFMYNQEVSWDGAAWTYSPVKYWPNNGYYQAGVGEAQYTDKISFFAYGPYQDHNAYGTAGVTGMTSNAVTSDPCLTFITAAAVKDQVDLVAAQLMNQKKKAHDAQIKFPFEHVLSRVGFTVTAIVDKVTEPDNVAGTGALGTIGTLDANTKIYVTQVDLIGDFDTEATYNLYSKAWGDNDTRTEQTYSWTAAADNFAQYTASAGVSASDNKQIVLASDENAQKKVNADDSYAMIIPQAAKNVRIKVTYNVVTEDTNLSGGKSTVSNVVTSNQFDMTFNQGKAYMFNIRLGMTSVKVDAAVADWAADENEFVNVPSNY